MMNYVIVVIIGLVLIFIAVFAATLLKSDPPTQANSLEAISNDFLENEPELRIAYKQKIDGVGEELELSVEWPDPDVTVDIKEFSHGWFVLRPMILNSKLLDDPEHRWVPSQCQAVYIKLPSREWRASGFLIRGSDAANPEEEARALLKEAFDGLPINGSKNDS
ncbi:MAG: hypothetical protein AAGI37_04785 [Planctomycetota bacterium]